MYKLLSRVTISPSISFHLFSDRDRSRSRDHFDRGGRGGGRFGGGRGGGRGGRGGRGPPRPVDSTSVITNCFE